jgi:hypothetical protein
MLELLITLAAGAIGYFLARNFVRKRLRFVDAIHSPVAPLVAGLAAAALAWPAAVLPFVTITTSLVFGIGTALGTASGSRALRQAAGGNRRLTP